MFVVNSLPVAIVFCVITMLGWGSWANTQKLAGKEKWPFQLFYWDYAIGVFLFSLVFAHTLGSFGPAGAPARENMHAAAWGFVLPALISGVLFNLSNILLVVGIDAAGMSVAFPVGVGLALVIGTVESYRGNAEGRPRAALHGRGADRLRHDHVGAGAQASAAERRAQSAARRDLLRHRGRADGLLLSAADAVDLAEFQLGADPARHADAVCGADLLRRRRAGQQCGVEHHLHAHGQRRRMAIISAAAPGCTPSAFWAGASGCWR